MAPSHPPSSDKTIRKIDIAQVSDFADARTSSTTHLLSETPVQNAPLGFARMISSGLFLVFLLTNWSRFVCLGFSEPAGSVGPRQGQVPEWSSTYTRA